MNYCLNPHCNKYADGPLGNGYCYTHDPTPEGDTKRKEANRKRIITLRRFNKDPEIRIKKSEAGKRNWQDPKYRAKMLKIMGNIGLFSPKSPEQRAKIGLAHKRLWQDPEHQKKMQEPLRRRWESSKYRRHHSKRASKDRKRNWQDPKYRMKHLGEIHPNWRGGVSFEPYCEKFNFQLKERVREKYGRRCVVCGKSAEENGRRLAVHHLDGNKMQGCEGQQWKLVPLCASCHSQLHNGKKFQARTEARLISNLQQLDWWRRL